MQCCIWAVHVVAEVVRVFVMPANEREAIFDALMGKLFESANGVPYGWSEFCVLAGTVVSTLACFCVLWHVCKIYRDFHLEVLLDNENSQPLLSGVQPVDNREISSSSSSSEYQMKLAAYYAQYGELGAKASLSGEPVEVYLDSLPRDEKARWETYMEGLWSRSTTMSHMSSTQSTSSPCSENSSLGFSRHTQMMQISS
mmetsp:Transcript_1886/g.2257  ORF Transcript_1886/g.2257 Transcript_1886/m.2257 type:complete len:199 (-) Transcript_1886:140-736(-)